MDERRTGWLLIFLLAAQLVLLSSQVPGDEGSGSYLETVLLRLVGPAARAVAATSRGVAAGRESLRLQRTLVSENRELRRQVEQLRLRLLRYEDIGREMARLGAALDYVSPPVGRIRAADVVYVDHSSWLRTLILYAGDRPVRRNQPVLSPAGLVGRVIATAGPYAKVQLITDGTAAVGGMLLRTRRQGVVRGSAGGAVGTLVLDYVPLQADVRKGDRVVTAGIDGVFPRGIPIGTVALVEPGGQLFHRIRLTPAVDFGTLDQVFLLEHSPVPDELKEARPGADR